MTSYSIPLLMLRSPISLLHTVLLLQGIGLCPASVPNVCNDTSPQDISAPKLSIVYTRPSVRETGPGEFTNFANTPGDFNRMIRTVEMNVCNNSIVQDAAKCRGRPPLFTFEIVSQTQDLLAASRTNSDGFESGKGAVGSSKVGRPAGYSGALLLTSKHLTRKCQLEWKAPREGTYMVSVNMTLNGHSVAGGRAKMEVKDIWYVAMGDSYASGQGNPDVNASTNPFHCAKWISPKCARSSLSYSYLIYEAIKQQYPNHGILFTYVACSGAKIMDGFKNANSKSQEPQLDIVSSLTAEARKKCPCQGCCKTSPDVLLFSVGTNDLDYYGTTTALLSGNMSVHIANLFGLKAKLRRSLEWLASQFTNYGIPADHIFHMEYPDPLRNSEGELDFSCVPFVLITQDILVQLDEKYRKALNRIIERSTVRHGWNYVGRISETSRTHGVCANVTYMRDLVESIFMQGEVLGTLHPNRLGHEVSADTAWPQIKTKLEGILMEDETRQREAWARHLGVK